MKYLSLFFLPIFFTVPFVSSSLAQERFTVRRNDGAKIPIVVYSHDGRNCKGSAIISHGAGGTENGMAYLASALAEDGWLSVVIGHAESGSEVLKAYRRKVGFREALNLIVTDPQAYSARLDDIDAVYRWVRLRCRSSTSVLLGHSMGSGTVMMEAGARNKMGQRGEDRFDAYVGISPQGPGSIFPEHAWERIRKPVLTLTGTEDNGLEGQWYTRRIPFMNMPRGCKSFGVIDGATHFNFAGLGFSRLTERLTVYAVRSFLDEAFDCRCTPLESKPGITFINK